MPLKNISKYVKNNIWIGPSGPNLLRENHKAYTAQHRFIRKHIIKIKLCSDPWNLNCKNLANEIDNKDGLYSGNIKDYNWVCHRCNLNNPLRRKRMSLSLLGVSKSIEHIKNMSNSLKGIPKKDSSKMGVKIGTIRGKYKKRLNK